MPCARAPVRDMPIRNPRYSTRVRKGRGILDKRGQDAKACEARRPDLGNAVIWFGHGTRSVDPHWVTCAAARKGTTKPSLPGRLVAFFSGPRLASSRDEQPQTGRQSRNSTALTNPMIEHNRAVPKPLLAAALVLATLPLPGQEVCAAGSVVDIDYQSAAVREMALALGQPSSDTLVSAASIDSRYIAFVDYNNLYCLDTRSASVRVVAHPQSLAGRWEPTGIAYHEPSKTLYLANYRGNNILEGSLDCAEGTFAIASVISSPETISPENVAISSDGGTLVSANYDGSSLTAFRFHSQGWTPLWTKRVPLAHGVAIIDEHAYATSLGDRTISRFDLQTGKREALAGQLGADPVQTDLMWPTGLTDVKGQLILTDAHSGYVCSIDKATLRAQTCFGGNGPGPGKFNMPYGIAPRGNNLLIASTFSSRLVEADVDFATGRLRILRDWYWTGNRKLNLPYFDSATAQMTRTPAYACDPYSSACQMPAWLPGYTCAYRGLATENQSKFLRFPTGDSILEASNGDEYYFIDSFAGRSDQDSYFFSPQLADVLNLRLVDDVPYAFNRPTGARGLQARGDDLVSPTLSVPKDQVRSEFDQVFASFVTKRNGSGVVPLADAAPLLMPGQDAVARLRARLAESIKASNSAAGARFLAEYANCTANRCDGERLRQSALAFASEQLKEKRVLVDRVIVPCMLADAKCGTVILRALSRSPSFHWPWTKRCRASF
jgi:DNA-binding beta-propeller fold protein YncE